MKAILRGLLRAILRAPPEVDLSFWWMNLVAKKILRINADCPWPVHMTSTVRHPGRIVRGRGAMPGSSPGNYIQAYNGIEIGDDVLLAPNVGLISANHDPDDINKHVAAEPIRIGNNCWLAMNVVILPGVELGPHTIVGAGAVVTKSFPDGGQVVAGNPARVIRKLDEQPPSTSTPPVR